MLQLAGVHKTFGRLKALDGLDLTIEPATTTALIGPSGCGKSTALRVMIGLLRPDAGRVLFDGKAIGDAPARHRAIRHRVGYVIQEGGLFGHLKARGNVTLMAQHLKWDAARIRTRLDELLELTKFPGDGLDRYPAQLSGGQRQRVALMRALMLDPDVLLLDEPLGALDPMIRYELQTDLRTIFQDRGKTTVLVTHDLAEAAYFGDSVVLMRDGAIVQQGRPSELLASPAEPFVERFVKAQRRHLDELDTGADS